MLNQYKISFVITLCSLVLMAYIHGLRIASFAEVPSSQRPAAVLVMAEDAPDYASELERSHKMAQGNR